MMYPVPTNGQTWLICGGRDFADQAMFDSAMLDLMGLYGCPAKVVHGDCRTGADQMADAWGKRLAIDVIPVPALWYLYGKGAGPIRNQLMLDKHTPRLVVAFPGGKGTADMVAKARAANVDVAEIRPSLPHPAPATEEGR